MKTTVTLTERDIQNLLTVLDWGMTDYDEQEHLEELEKLFKKLQRAQDRIYSKGE